MEVLGVGGREGCGIESRVPPRPVRISGFFLSFPSPDIVGCRPCLLVACSPLVLHSPCFTEPLEPKLISVRIEFYDNFLHEANEYDRNFVENYEDSTATLIFVSIFRVHVSPGVNFVFPRYRPACLRGCIHFHCQRSSQARTRFPRGETNFRRFLPMSHLRTFRPAQRPLSSTEYTDPTIVHI